MNLLKFNNFRTKPGKRRVFIFPNTLFLCAKHNEKILQCYYQIIIIKSHGIFLWETCIFLEIQNVPKIIMNLVNMNKLIASNLMSQPFMLHVT